MTHYLEQDPLEAFKYIIESLKKSSMIDIQNEVEMAKAMYFLKKKRHCTNDSYYEEF